MAREATPDTVFVITYDARLCREARLSTNCTARLWMSESCRPGRLAERRALVPARRDAGEFAAKLLLLEARHGTFERG